MNATDILAGMIENATDKQYLAHVRDLETILRELERKDAEIVELRSVFR